MAWSSKKIPRVVRSTLGAEAVALSNTVDRLSWIRVFWAWMKDSRTKWQSPEKLLQEEPTGPSHGLQILLRQHLQDCPPTV